MLHSYVNKENQDSYTVFLGVEQPVILNHEELMAFRWELDAHSRVASDLAAHALSEIAYGRKPPAERTYTLSHFAGSYYRHELSLLRKWIDDRMDDVDQTLPYSVTNLARWRRENEVAR